MSSNKNKPSPHTSPYPNRPRRPFSPATATVAGYGLYFYAEERQQRPHVDVRRGAEHAILDVVTREVLALSRYVVELAFANGNLRVIDLEPMLWGEMFEPLKADYALFKSVSADPEAATIVWPNGADLSPRTLYAESKPTVPA